MATGNGATKNGHAPTLTVEQWGIDRVREYERNPRKNEKAVAKVAASIKAFGFRQPIVVDRKGVVVAGHTRLKAARELGLSNVPVHVAKNLSPAQVKAYRLADNRTGEEAEWDADLLPLEFADLRGLDFDLTLTGFDPAEIAGFEVKNDHEESPDVDLTPPKKPKSERGHVYQLGRHRVMCGDATKDDVATLLDGAIPKLMVTDPPYGVEYTPEWRNEALGEADRRVGVVANDGRIDWTEAWERFPGSVVYCWHNAARPSEVEITLRAAGFDIRCQIVWAKPSPVIARGGYHWQHETCWYAVRKGATAGWIGDRSQTTLWSIPMKDDTDQKEHSTQKPTECMARPIRNHEGDVYDPFCGTGTTVVASEKNGRTCYAMEIDPGYTDVIRRRYAEFVGDRSLLP